jgi:2-keto-3-deoxy-L-rhamnonate aldolase RhmA
MPTDDDWARRYRELGFRMMAYGADTMLLQHALAAGLRNLRGT